MPRLSVCVCVCVCVNRIPPCLLKQRYTSTYSTVYYNNLQCMTCSGVEVKVLKIGNTQVKQKCLKITGKLLSATDCKCPFGPLVVPGPNVKKQLVPVNCLLACSLQ